MAILPRRSSGDFTPPSKGLHSAEVTNVEEAKDIISPFDDPDDPKPKIKIHFRLLDENRDDGNPHEFSELYTNSLYEKAKLVQHLVGAGLDPDKIMDLEDLVGLRLRINVGHRVSKKGGTFPCVLSWAPAEQDRGPFQATDSDVPF